jgi:uncharacterized protein YrrD
MKALELKGTMVITLEGERIGKVEGMLFHPDEQRLRALLVKSDRFAGMQILPIDAISSFGKDAITIQNVTKLVDRARYEGADPLESLDSISGRKVVTTSGTHVGSIDDMNIDPATGRITSYDVSGGVFGKMFGRGQHVEAGEDTRLGKDLLVVPDHVVTGDTSTRSDQPDQMLHD